MLTNIWYIRDCPLTALRMEGVPENNKAPWFDKLVADIAARGLASPLLVRDGVVRTGMNRLRALRQLGWSTAPVIRQGANPPGAAEALITLSDVQSRLGDGKATMYNDGSLSVRFATKPETETYPTTTEPYFND